MDTSDFILLKAIFCQELHDAVINKDEKTIKYLLATKYEFEKGFYKHTDINLESLSTEHQMNLKEHLDWAI